jgi:hypothetical protein
VGYHARLDDDDGGGGGGGGYNVSHGHLLERGVQLRISIGPGAQTRSPCHDGHVRQML